MQTRWQDKSLHSQCSNHAKQGDIDKTQTHQWLCSAELKAENVGCTLALENQYSLTRNHHANILKKCVDPKCRFCEEYPEQQLTILYRVTWY